MWTPFPRRSTYPRSCQLTTTMTPELLILNHSERAAADSLLSLGREGPGPSASLSSPKRVREENDYGRGYYMMPRKRYAVGPFANAQYYPAPNLKSSYESAIGFPLISPDNSMVKSRRVALHPAQYNFPLRRIDSHHASFAAPANNYNTSNTPRLISREINRAVSVSPASIDLNSSPIIPEDDITKASTETDFTGSPEDDEPPKIFDPEAVISLNFPSLRSEKLGPLTKNHGTKENHGTNTTEDIVPSLSDVLIGTGRTCSSHPGNRRFHKAIYESFQEYFSADYKKGVVDRAIASVHEAGGRFLAKGKHTTWVMVKDMDRLERNTRKSFHMAKKQRQRENHKVTDDVMPHHRNKSTSTRKLTTPKFHTGLHVAVYRKTVGAYCIGKIEAQENGNCLLRFDDSRFGVEWVDLNRTDCRVISD
jgi:hypothetical protein